MVQWVQQDGHIEDFKSIGLFKYTIKFHGDWGEQILTLNLSKNCGSWETEYEG